MIASGVDVDLGTIDYGFSSAHSGRVVVVGVPGVETPGSVLLSLRDKSGMSPQDGIAF
jgi:hypothetical protein